MPPSDRKGSFWQKATVFLLDYINFMAFLLFVLINITLGRALRHIDRRFKTRYLERLTQLFEKLA